jgi:PIN domain nuclease of toxin-antitoxin system
MVVCDSSSLIAVLRRERGGVIVRRLLRAHRGEVFCHAANLLEVFVYFARWVDEPAADRALGILERAGVLRREDFDPDFQRDAGALIADARRQARGLALGDSLGIALARRLDCEFVTADHGEIDHLAATGVVRVQFIR